MAGLYNNAYALRLESFGEYKSDLLCQPFLNLKPSREHFNHSNDLGEANYIAVRNVSNVYLALLACSSLGTGR
jgi:hypothetical protein